MVDVYKRQHYIQIGMYGYEFWLVSNRLKIRVETTEMKH